MNSQKKISLIIGIIIIVTVVGIVVAQNSNKNSYQPPTNSVPIENNLNPDAKTNATTTTVTATSTTLSVKQYTLADVAQHSNSSSCWSAVNNSVYNLTSWISKHPGGQQAILSICGKDGSAAFNDQHGGQRRPANELAGFKIGVLIQQK